MTNSKPLRQVKARPPRCALGRERGSSIVEGALALTIVLLMTFGMIQFSYISFGRNAIAYAARAGSRYAAVHGSASPSPCTAATIQTRVENQLAGIPASAVTVTTVWTPNNSPGSTVRVTVAASFGPMTKLVMKNGLTLTAVSQMTILQ